MNKYEFYGKVVYKDDGYVIIECPLSVVNYYRWWVEKFIGKKTSTSYHKPHITIVAGKYDKGLTQNPNWNKFDGKLVKVQYEANICTDNNWLFMGEYFWLKVNCSEIKEIRNSIGLSDKPYHPPHLTICYRGY